VDSIAALDALVQFVSGNCTEVLRDDQLKRFQELDDIVAVAALRLGIPQPARLSQQVTGFTRVPIMESLDPSFTLSPSDEWGQEIKQFRMLLELRLKQESEAQQSAVSTSAGQSFEVPLEDRSVVKTQADLVSYAKQNCGCKSLAERTLRVWLSDGSLRHRRRGQLLEFSISDLKALCRDQSQPDSKAKPGQQPRGNN